MIVFDFLACLKFFSSFKKLFPMLKLLDCEFDNYKDRFTLIF